MRIKLCVLLFFGIMHFGVAQEPVKDSVPVKKSEILIMYGSINCHYCIDTKAYLKEKKIPFEFYDIDQDEQKMYEMLLKLNKNGMNTSNVRLPVIDQSGKLLMNSSDFDSFLEKLVPKK